MPAPGSRTESPDLNVNVMGAAELTAAVSDCLKPMPTATTPTPPSSRLSAPAVQPPPAVPVPQEKKQQAQPGLSASANHKTATTPATATTATLIATAASTGSACHGQQPQQQQQQPPVVPPPPSPEAMRLAEVERAMAEHKRKLDDLLKKSTNALQVWCGLVVASAWPVVCTLCCGLSLCSALLRCENTRHPPPGSPFCEHLCEASFLLCFCTMSPHGLN